MNWVFFAGLSAASAGLIPVLAKRGGDTLDPTLATVFRAIVMTASLAVTALLLGRFRQMPVLDRPAVSQILWTGIACAASWIFYFMALKTGPASKVVAIDRTSAAFTLVLAALFLGEALTWRSAFGMGMILTGLMIALNS